MITRLTEIVKDKNISENKQSSYALREVFVNSEHVVCLREDFIFAKLLTEGQLMEDLDSRQAFTKVYLNRGQSGIDLTVVGSPGTIQEKLGLDKPQLLKG
tara:strand:- start:95 stop:394 length:300 start_codon:yes stop_codon:yes gene_type:complete